jgi:hypothetical protein
MPKKYLKKITDALSGVDSDMPVIRSTPDQKPARPSQGGPKPYSQSWGSEGFDPSTAKLVPSADMGTRMRDESRAFYNSDKGKNTDDFVTMNGDKARNPDKRAGSGFGVKIASGTPTMTPKQISDFIGQHAAGNHGAKLDDFSAGLKVNNYMSKKKPEPKRPDFMNMHEIPESKPQGGNYMTKGDNYVTKPSGGPLNNAFDVGQYYKNAKLATASKARKSKFTLNDTDMAIGAAGATGYGLGEGINAAMDQSYENGKMVNNQQNAHSYWTRKKNGQ